MKITIFTSNQPRHVALINRLASMADEVYAVQECNTLFPGEVADFFKKSDVMREYFQNVIFAEREVFGDVQFLAPNVRSISMKMGDLNRLSLSALKPALESDHYVVFGATYIREPLIDFLVKHKAYNIHVGISPYYRGNSCNFWALYDGRPDMVGATIHQLSKGLDSGPMLFHAVPKAQRTSGFVLGMKAVLAAHMGLAEALAQNSLKDMAGVPQDKSLEKRYTRNIDFNDEVASQYLATLPSPEFIEKSLRDRDMSQLLNPKLF